jgi:DNA-binding transcriptional ArsR family regulator
MRLVDLRSTTSSPPTAPRITARASAAAELLRLIGVIVDEDPDEYDVGAARIAEVRAQVPQELLDDIVAMLPDARDDKSFLVLALLAASLPEPAGIEEFLDTVRAEPERPWRVLLAHSARELDEPDTDGLRHRLLAGDPAAVTRLESLVAEGCCSEGTVTLMTMSPEEYGERLLDIVERFDRQLWRHHAEEAMGPIRRDVAHRNQQLADGADVGDVVLAATNGFELPEDPSIREIVLLPSYWFRPWLVVGNIGVDGLEVMSTAVADEFVALPSEVPPPALLKLFKALGDAGRLALLRRMTSGPISLGQAAAELDVAKATAHHHLAILRQAGLVSIRGSGRSTKYGLREDPAELARDALARYVPQRPGSPGRPTDQG